jgi:hypothetical protein
VRDLNPRPLACHGTLACDSVDLHGTQPQVALRSVSLGVSRPKPVSVNEWLPKWLPTAQLGAAWPLSNRAEMIRRAGYSLCMLARFQVHLTDLEAGASTGGGNVKALAPVAAGVGAS